MDSDVTGHDMEPGKDVKDNITEQNVPTEPTVRKGRRGLARKKSAPPLSQDIPSTTHHNTSVYTSCVSRGFQSMLGEIRSTPTQEKDCNGDNKSEKTEVHTFSTEAHEEDVNINTEIATTVEQNGEISEINLFDEEETDLVPVSGLESLRSPTPPPTSLGLAQTKRPRMNRKLKSALKTLNKAKGNLDLTPSTPFSKTRGKKTKITDNSIILLEDSSPTVKSDMIIKIRYLSSVHRFQLKLTNPFHNLLSHLSRETGQEEQHLSLFLHDQVLPLSKTPKEVGLTVADIIECHCIKDAKGGEFNESITLLIQCSNSKRKTEINVTMRLPFKEILEKYSEQVGISASSFSFCFDGEDVEPSDTPLTLEMDDGDILDLVPYKEPGSRHRSAWKNSVITII